MGQSIYNDPANADSRKGAHIAVGTGIIGLFGVNAVTGVWNMVEDRHNPQGRKLRLVHGIADADGQCRIRCDSRNRAARTGGTRLRDTS